MGRLEVVWWFNLAFEPQKHLKNDAWDVKDCRTGIPISSYRTNYILWSFLLDRDGDWPCERSTRAFGFALVKPLALAFLRVLWLILLEMGLARGCGRGFFLPGFPGPNPRSTKTADLSKGSAGQQASHWGSGLLGAKSPNRRAEFPWNRKREIWKTCGNMGFVLPCPALQPSNLGSPSSWSYFRCFKVFSSVKVTAGEQGLPAGVPYFFKKAHCFVFFNKMFFGGWEC